MTKFKDIPIGTIFQFANSYVKDGVNYIKVSQRCYIKMICPGIVEVPRLRIGSINVEVIVK